MERARSSWRRRTIPLTPREVAAPRLLEWDAVDIVAVEGARGDSDPDVEVVHLGPPPATARGSVTQGHETAARGPRGVRLALLHRPRRLRVRDQRRDDIHFALLVLGCDLMLFKSPSRVCQALQAHIGDDR